MFEQPGLPLTKPKVMTTPKRGGMTSGLKGHDKSQRLKDAGFHFVQATVV
ncbi:hypothetical protein CLOSTMETH_00149 [[Clostridium] methylpentosum DSM 5476]|uniref:Uncharacterized protein n=1 Tax=[Clostridium] methylpentosum DSM 5476 TaxID=537013 RepID=C0E8K4_9FIRM|nr:hypothetical protein CLOSTMETH_00149 [[Clostridium] methylpentosum DSM 5476]